MDDILVEMLRAINHSKNNSDAAVKCAAVAKAYTLKVLDGIMLYKDKDGDKMYTNIAKIRMRVKNNEI